MRRQGISRRERGERPSRPDAGRGSGSLIGFGLDAGRAHELVPDLGAGGRRIVELLERHDPLEADHARLAGIGLELVLVLLGDLDGPAQGGLLVDAVDQHHPVLDHDRRPLSTR